MTVAEKLKAIRIEHNLTQKELSDRLGIGQATIACYENAQHDPHISILTSYADYFECSIDYLLGRTDEFGIINITNQTSTMFVTKEEREFLVKFRSLDKDKRNKLLGYIDAIS